MSFSYLMPIWLQTFRPPKYILLNLTWGIKSQKNNLRIPVESCDKKEGIGDICPLSSK